MSSARRWKRSARGGVGDAIAVGTLAGMRALSAPTVTSWVLRREKGSRRQDGRIVAGLTTSAVGELIADKTPWVGSRLLPAPLLSRVVAGAWSAAALTARKGRSRAAMAALGGSVAVAAAVTFNGLRRRATERWQVPNVAAGLIEDLGALALADVIARRVHRRS